MQFEFLGINFKHADLTIRDKVSFTDHRKIDFLQTAETLGVHQCMILSTCNRSEVYFFAESKDQVAAMHRLYCDTFSEVLVDQYLLTYHGQEAMKYLFEVTAGLQSQVIGEDQILGQVKDALDFSRTMGYSGKEMNYVVRAAITCAKEIKTKLKVSEIPISISYVGIKELEKQCSLSGKRVMVIGSGKMAVLALKYIYEYGAEKVYLCSRTLAHAKKRQELFPKLEIVEFENRYDAMKDCDIVISATASPHTVIQQRKLNVTHEMYFLDLAAPRDVDPEITTNMRCHLINLDTLNQVVQEHQKEREELMIKSQDILKDALWETTIWLHSSRMDATIESLQNRCVEIEEDSCAYLNRKLDLSSREQVILQKTIHASLQRLLKEPISELKSLETKEEQMKYREIVNRLFRLQ